MSRPFTLGALLAVFVALAAAAEPKPLKILFLGDNGHHRPMERFRQLQPVLAARGIDITYTDKMDVLSDKVLASYDGLMIYANTTQISPEQEKALLDFVAGGKGLIPLHCASYCFLNSPKYIELVGAQFQKHGTGTFRTIKADVDHPILKGYQSFESWDETYVHHKHNEKDRTVLEYRNDANGKEPWTWVRSHGKGRVFYTAWGHDERTWSNVGFHNLIERGIRWATGGDPTTVRAFADKPDMVPLRKDVKPFEYVEARVPFYPAGQRWGVTAEPISKMQKPIDPAESMKHMVYPVGFEPQLFVSEPELGGKPIAMNWDERGRLWVAITIDYPNELRRDGDGRDKILICEDTDNDGKADKFTVFADKLSIPTSLIFANGGLIVHSIPHTIFLKDTDGDDMADVRKILFSGWGTGDTHAGPSNLRYGLDNWIYGMVGYSGFDGIVGGTRVSFRTGFYRFKPDGSKMEFLRNTTNNSWGVGFSEEGLLFGSTANGCPSVYLPIPNRYYESVRGWSSSVLQSIAYSNKFEPITDKVRQVDFHGGFTAGAGHALYTARTYPKEYWNRTAFVTEPTGHLAATFVLQKNGSDFRAKYGWNLLASDDEWCGPIMAEVGPDGHMWIIDWYNFIVQHNPTPAGFRTGRGAAYETELRDKKHGRIYRLVYKDAKPTPSLTLKDAPPEKLVAALMSDNMFWRLHAQRLLVERGKRDVVPELIKLIGDPSSDAIGLNAGVTHALWTLQGLGVIDDSTQNMNPIILASLHHASAGVRRNAAAIVPRTADGAKALLASGVLDDADAQVRLAALLALAECPPSAEAGSAIVRTLSKPENADDRWIPHAATSAAAAHDFHFLSAVAAERTPPPIRSVDTLAIVAEHYARGGPSATAGKLMEKLADANADIVETILAGLAKGWPRNRQAELTAETEQAMTRLLARIPAGSKSRLLRLAAAWGSKEFQKQGTEIAATLMATALSDKQNDGDRIASAKQIVEFLPTDMPTLTKLLDVVSPRVSPQVAIGIIEAVGSSSAPEVGPAIITRSVGWPPTVRTAAIRALLSRTESTKALLDAMDGGKIQITELTLDQKQALASHTDAKVAERAKTLLARGGGLPSPDRQKVIDEFTPLLKRTGDVAAGKAMFKKHCANCHTHSGEGTKIGPDLSGMAAHPKHELLIHIMDPSRSVEGNFRIYNVLTKDGRVFAGMLASETKTSVELIDAQAKRHVLLRDDIDELAASTKSLMPEGFEKQLSADEFVNLLEMLTQRGKYLPLPLDKVATVVSTRGMFYNEEATGERLVFRDWSPKTFNDVPFVLVDPLGEKHPNAVMLYSPNGKLPPKMPKGVRLPCAGPAKAIHLLSGISGWGYPYSEKGSLTLTVRIHYADDKTEDHQLRNGVHFADYIRRVDVPESKFAFSMRGQQLRYLSVQPQRTEPLKEIEFIKGDDQTAPLIMAVTVESP